MELRKCDLFSTVKPRCGNSMWNLENVIDLPRYSYSILNLRNLNDLVQ